MEKVLHWLKNYPNFIKRHNKAVLIIFLLTVGILTFINYERIRLMHFTGIVQKVVYARDRRPTVTINGEDYDLFSTFNSLPDKQIEIGDKMIKKRGDIYFRLIKRNSKDTIGFYDGENDKIKP